MTATLQHHDRFRLADAGRLPAVDHAEIGRVPVAVAGFNQVAMNLSAAVALLVSRGGKARLMLKSFAQQAHLTPVGLAETVEVNPLRPESPDALPGQQANQQRKG